MSFINYELQSMWDKRDFNDWLNKNVENDKKNSDIIFEIIGDISELLYLNNYKIKNKKQFKDEIASYVYRDSINYEQ